MPDRQLPGIPARDPLGAIPPSRHPFQVWSMLALLLGGVGNVAHPQGLAHDLLPVVMVQVFGVIMAFSGFFAIVAAFWHDRVSGLLMERIALGAAALTSFLYAIIIGTVVGTSGSVGFWLCLSLGGASVWRIVHVNRELKIIRAFIESHMG